MIYLNYLKNYLIISLALSTITCTLVQKTKAILKNSKNIIVYSLTMNLIIGIFFSYTFTNISFPNSLWIGFFSF